MTHSGKFEVQCTPDQVFELLADPGRFAPLFPDFESLEITDATHFLLRTVVVFGQIRGHANLLMEMREVVKPSRVAFQGEGVVAGSQLRMRMDFNIGQSDSATEVNWQGEVSLSGGLAMLVGPMVDAMGGENFGRMAKALEEQLRCNVAEGPGSAPAQQAPASGS